MKPSEKTYWIKTGAAVVAGALCFFAQTSFNIDGSLIFVLGALLYLTFSDLLSNLMKLERNHGLKVGIGAYIFVWVTVWTLLYTAFTTLKA